MVIEIIDEFCPWNAGRWRIGAEGVDRTDEARICDVTSVRWARSTSTVLLGRSWHARSVSKTWSPAPLPGRTPYSEWKSHRGAQRFFERIRTHLMRVFRPIVLSERLLVRTAEP